MANVTRKCNVPTCERVYYANGYCHAHMARVARLGHANESVPIGAPPREQSGSCQVDGCDSLARVKGQCAYHYGAFFRQGNRLHGVAPTCSVDGCSTHARSRGWCSRHYSRFLTYGTTDLPDRAVTPRKKRKTTQINHPDGYVSIKRMGHPNARANGWILEHRAVMSDALGRPLRKGENVHHKNGDRKDNRIENLELWTKAQPAGQRVSEKIAWAIAFLSDYRPQALAPAEQSAASRQDGLHVP